VISELKIDVQGAVADSLVLPNSDRLLLGDALRLHGRLEGALRVSVSGVLHGQKLQRELTLSAQPEPHLHGQLALEWARARVAQLEAEYRSEPSDALRSQIVALGTEHSLATMFTSFVASDSLGPDRVMPGDPELRVRAPRSAEAVFARLPWGEIVHCSYSEDEQLWLGRFLVPRSLRDELYRVRVFVTQQGLTELRTSLYVRVDSRPPQFSLALSPDRRRLVATPLGDVFDAGGDSVRPDRADVRSVVVRLGHGDQLVLRQEGELWTVELSELLPPGSHTATLVASDFASNTSESVTRLQVAP
jgi:hypothetical protein